MTKTTLMEYLAASVVGNEDYANRVLPTLDIDESSRNIQRCWLKAETHILLRVFNALKQGDLSVDENITDYRYKTPWDLYGMTIHNTIESKPRTPHDGYSADVMLFDEVAVS